MRADEGVVRPAAVAVVAVELDRPFREGLLVDDALSPLTKAAALQLTVARQAEGALEVHRAGDPRVVHRPGLYKNV